jgi:hypothetical protein
MQIEAKEALLLTDCKTSGLLHIFSKTKVTSMMVATPDRSTSSV